MRVKGSAGDMGTVKGAGFEEEREGEVIGEKPRGEHVGVEGNGFVEGFIAEGFDEGVVGGERGEMGRGEDLL